MLYSNGKNNFFNKLPLFQNDDTFVAPTTGTQAQVIELCEEQLSLLQELTGRARARYTDWTRELETLLSENEKIKDFSPNIYVFNKARFELATNFALLILEEVEKTCNAKFVSEVIPKIQNLLFKDVGLATAKYSVYARDMDVIGKAAGDVKRESASKDKRIEITNKESTLLPTLAPIPLKKYKYHIELYMVTPGGERIQVEQYIKEFLYTRLYDVNSLPIMSVLMLLPQTVITHIKFHNEKIKWYITVSASEKNSENTKNVFTIPEVMLKDVQLIPVDPTFNVTPQAKVNEETNSMPIYPFKIDLVSYRDTMLNTSLKSRIFTNARVLDVITTLCAELRAEYTSRQEPTAREVKITVAPPDNVKVYEQILVEPGSFTKCIHQLQEKYGIYSTGVRVNFDSVSTKLSSKNNNGNTLITILGKGDTAPGQDTIKDVIIDLVDSKVINRDASVLEPFFDSGQFIDDVTGTTILRSFFPYLVLRNNSDSLVNGEAIKVMNSSAQDHLTSYCDTENSDLGMEKVYWSRYANPFNLMQIQDSVRESKIQVQCEFKDINPLLLNNNQSYRIKFYGEDDLVYTGDYRLTELRFYYRMGKTVQGLSESEISTIMTFYNVPPLKVNGTEVPRQSYTEKLNASRALYSGTSEGEEANLSNYLGGRMENNNSISADLDLVTGPPFKCTFEGRYDFYGTQFLSTIPPDWKMSDHVQFKDLYEIQFANNSKYAIANALANQFQLFINAQKFANEVIENCWLIFKTLGSGNKLHSWFRLARSTSQHTVSLAVDSTWGEGAGNLLCERFLKLMNSSIEFDQLILENSGGGWSFIHISKNMNGRNRGDVKCNIGGQYKNIRIGSVGSPEQLFIQNIMLVVY